MPLNFNSESYGADKSSVLQFSKQIGLNLRINPSYLKTFTANKLLRLKNSQTLNNSLDLKTEENILFLKKMKCYRGIRHRNNYPVRGQRTHTNATKKTNKKKRMA